MGLSVGGYLIKAKRSRQGSPVSTDPPRANSLSLITSHLLLCLLCSIGTEYSVGVKALTTWLPKGLEILTCYNSAGQPGVRIGEAGSEGGVKTAPDPASSLITPSLRYCF